MTVPSFGRSWRLWTLLAAVAFVLAPTMRPAQQYSSTPKYCIVCGEQGVADALANIVLFVPLGAALGLQRWRVRTQFLFAVAVTLIIESSQANLIPGRDASLGDLLFNSVGAAVGIAVARTVRHWIVPRNRLNTLLQLGVSLFAGTVILLTGMATQPRLEAQRYRIAWGAAAGPDQGDVESVALGNRVLPVGDVDEPNLVSDAVTAGSALMIRGTAGPPRAGFTVFCTIRDEHNRDLWMLGRYGDDLIITFRAVATAWRLRGPYLRVAGSMQHIQEGDRLALELRRSGAGFTVTVNGASYPAEFRASDGWRLILPAYGAFSWIGLLPAYIWIAGLLFPLGVWMNRSWATVAAVSILGVVAAAATGLDLLGRPGWTELTGSVVGLFAGVAVHRLGARGIGVQHPHSAAETA